MNRSTFLVVVALMGVRPGFADGPKPGEAAALRTKIDGLLRAEMARWHPAAVDRENGGFHQEFARDWTIQPDVNKFLVYQSRMTWTAAAYAEYDHERHDEYVGYARHGVDFLDRKMRDVKDGGFHWIVNARGEVDPALGDEKHVYGTAFALYAASKAFEATKDPRALQAARDAFDWLETHAHDREHGGYFEALTRAGAPILSWPEGAPVAKRQDRLGIYYGYKTMNSHIHLLEAVAEFSRVEKTPIVKQRLAELLAIVRDRIAAEPGALNLYLSRDWKPAPAHDSFGHDVETAYLLVEAAAALGTPDDPATWKVARMLVDHALDWGWDAAHGGFYDKGDVFAAGSYDFTKVWWTQAEGLNALLVMHLKYGDSTPRYWDAFTKQWSFIEAHQLDPEHGGWYGEVTREGKRIGPGPKATQWKADYHTGRAMMNVATMLRTLEAKGR